ncbi:MAG: zinc ribbon domain-containing protein [Armatimonadetes bacterium]|nr:zinc ribbon domain-containing protein [Armatimonadota bacterium]
MSAPNEISEGRQAIYYVGMALVVIGIVLFFSVFVSFFTAFAPFAPPTGGQCTSGLNGKLIPCSEISGLPVPVPHPPDFTPALIGFGMIFVGGILMSIGRAGMAGSGIVLDPQQAREDLKPYSHMAGGMLDDALSSSPTVQKLVEHHDEDGKTVIKIRCPHCRALNDENAKFCSQCGQAL